MGAAAVRGCPGWDALGSAGPRPCPRGEVSARPGSAAPGPRGGVCWRAEVAAKDGAKSREVVPFPVCCIGVWLWPGPSLNPVYFYFFFFFF